MANLDDCENAENCSFCDEYEDERVFWALDVWATRNDELLKKKRN